MSGFAPIILFTYNRPFHTAKTIEALKNNRLAERSDLVIFSDGAKKNDEDKLMVGEVRKIINQVSGFNKIDIVKRENNKGLAASVIGGVTKVLSKYGKVIVLEDKLVTSQNFIAYMNDALDFYDGFETIGSITGDHHPPETMKIPSHYDADIYFCPRHASWGWATWRSKWENIDWNMKDFDRWLENPEFNTR